MSDTHLLLVQEAENLRKIHTADRATRTMRGALFVARGAEPAIQAVNAAVVRHWFGCVFRSPKGCATTAISKPL
jgi:hypothetical protein